MKIIVVSALATVVLLSGIAPNAMANQRYWTASDSYPGLGLQRYHIYLYGSYPSSTGEATKIVNEHLRAYPKIRYDYSSMLLLLKYGLYPEEE